MENFRTLIERAMRETQAEFAAVVARKLNELLGSTVSELGRRPMPQPVKPKLQAARGRVPSTKAAPLPSKRRRSTPADLAALQEKLLHAMEPGRAMKKGEIMKAARLGDADDLRVTNVLAKLREAGIITMQGQKRLATYVLKADGGE